jgi:thiamine biosynthesis protein ThiI
VQKPKQKKEKAKIVALLSGGIDSPVATALALQKGLEVIALHFRNYPFSDRKGEEKSKAIAEMLAKRFGKKIKFILVPHGETHKAILQNCEARYSCVLCKRFMQRIAGKIAEQEGAQALLMGDSLGQVASQTLHNLLAEKSATAIPIARPLLGIDKIEIEKLARKFGTFEKSIEPGLCCNAVPEKPATRARIEAIADNEKKLDVNGIVEKALAGKEVLFFG